MKESFILSKKNAVLNFTKYYCTSNVELLESEAFYLIVDVHFKYLKRKEKPLYYSLKSLEADETELINDLVILFKLLLTLEVNEIKAVNLKLEKYLDHKDQVLEFVETLYDYWRSLERYALVFNTRTQKGIQNSQFIHAHDEFQRLILDTYRSISERIMSRTYKVYRQLIAGVNAGIILNEYSLSHEKGVYDILRPIPIIESIILHPPFITYPSRNKRDGIFKEVAINPLQDVDIDSDDFLCYPAKVGRYFALIYFHRDFMSMGVTLANLFELAEVDYVENNKPDIIYVFGVKDEEAKTCFYNDKEADILVGYASYSEEFDYFGYMKKMVLTLHNIKGIHEGGLPIHGAMAQITMDNNETKNIIIVGDSGAGKSETLEALHNLENNGIHDIKIIFDDMGILFNENGIIKAYGTEIGAFVRLDDLDVGYAYRTIDRSIFMNPDKINARIVIPVATYQEIIKGYEVDLIAYANNYELNEPIIEMFDDINIAKDTFKSGARLSKGTTTEVGLVKSFFANPFGPVQKEKETNILIDEYFNLLYQSKINVGQLKTKLGYEEYKTSGPHHAAQALLAILNSKEY